MIKALVVVPYEGLLEMMKEVSQEVEDIELHIELGNLYEGVAIAKNAENEGYHVIISRGGTASMIQEAVPIPVIDIQVSGYDVLRILTLVKGFSGKAAIVGFSNITQGAATICKLLDLDIKTLTITKDNEVKGKLTGLKKNGYEVVIGDVVTMQAAKQLGMTGVLITSGKEAIMDALEETRRSYRLFSRLQRDITLMETILDSDEHAIGVFNQDEKIVYGNERFHNEFHWLNLDNATDVKKLIQETTLTNEKQVKLLYINNKLWKITSCPIKDKVALFFEKTHSNQITTHSGQANQTAIELHTSASRTPISGKSEAIQKVLEQIDLYGNREEPIWIMGEQGNGKELVAHSIYLKRKTADEPLITLRCDVISAEQLKDLIKDDFFQKYSNRIIFLKNIDQLNSYMQKELLRVLKDESEQKPQWIVSSKDNIEERIKNKTFHRELFRLLSPLQIQIPPLRERKEDMEELVPVFISDLHPKYGNKVVGIRDDALEQMMDYDWPGNVGQLKHVMEQLFLESQSYYIEKAEVDIVFKRLKQQEKWNDALSYIDISGTLEEIERQVITKVLEDEGMNQSRAAKRLGINRSTLWRKLKE
ncbi:sigma-54-dependent Fis family transcriptional regulator [Bacilli bacterium]|nr:Fis family transcriptional regulator [Bacilli bacterium VT-13-104]PZD82979.1 sigma-54-dependent Fis family transcriptional regulator [Bacilli bacterium]PZD83694.1 sigma-54-dependent Fis family transcriptional regulator [Bacilli bacterium]PZD85490.1 sigma-54-dependent Fis family transcriptional regulator [Bacilli bacterium]RCO05547.1 sigma-54-dependent Fis family transcriptional regulator [Bacilli bacterium]